MGIDKKSAALVGGALVFIFLVQIVPPIAQDPDYHRFADRRSLFGIPHFWNVVSNLPFLLLGTLGLSAVALNRTPGYLPELKPVYMMFYAGVFLTGLASAHYHLNPANETLVWDRLALTIVFMAFFAAVWGEHISATMGLKMVWPLTGIGLMSVVYWYVTESLGRGDLRFYALVQFLPMVLLPVMMVAHKSQLTGVAYIWGVIVAYALSKVAEVLDGPIYRALDGFSGHEIKHWVAAVGIFIYYRAGFRRARRP
ncbi:MAG: hypothetical protein PVJ84_03600 [Desulfobacteraceae bacterium]|jgi:hypothetical protein